VADVRGENRASSETIGDNRLVDIQGSSAEKTWGQSFSLRAGKKEVRFKENQESGSQDGE